MNEPSKSKAVMSQSERERRNKFASEIAIALHTETKQLMHRTVFPSVLQSTEDQRRERNLDLEYESRVDYESWQYDGPEESGDQ